MALGSEISHGTGVRQKSPLHKGQRMPAMRALTLLWEFFALSQTQRDFLPDRASEAQLKNTQNHSSVPHCVECLYDNFRGNIAFVLRCHRALFGFTDSSFSFASTADCRSPCKRAKASTAAAVAGRYNPALSVRVSKRKANKAFCLLTAML